MKLTPYNVEDNAAGFGAIAVHPQFCTTIRGWSFHGVILYAFTI
jgi:hypothetical protein